MERKTVIVTGASRGIGAAIAAAAFELGAQVVLTARTGADLAVVAQKIEKQGGTVLAMEGDISQYEHCRNIVDRTIKTFGRIDALVNNAAVIGPLQRISEVPPDEWARTLSINFIGAALMCREAIPYLRQTKGRVLNVSSTASVEAVPGGSVYCSSKAALNHFTRVLANEEPLITAVAFNPGETDTQMQAEIREKTKDIPFEGLHNFLSACTSKVS